MAWAVADSFAMLPFTLGSTSSAPSMASITTIDADGEAVAFLIEAPVTDSINEIGFPIGIKTSNGDMDVRIETDNGSGSPSGTLWGTNTNGSVTITAANTWYTATLTSAASVTKGDRYWVVLQRPSGGTLNARPTYQTSMQIGVGLPGVMSKTSASFVYSSSANTSIGISYTSAGYIRHVQTFPISGITSTNFSSSSSPDVYGNTYTPTYAHKANHIALFADFDGDVTVKVIDNDGSTVLASSTNPSYIPLSAGASLNMILLDNEVTFTPGNTYRIICEPGSTPMTMYRYNFDSATIRAAMSGGNNWVATSAKDPTGNGDYTDDTDAMYAIFVIPSAYDDGAGGGGGGGSIAYGNLG